MDQWADRHDHHPVIATMRVHEADDLAQVRRLLADTAADVGLPANRIDQLTIALNEVATNAILHGNGGATMTITSSDTEVMVEVRDHGTGLRTTPHPGMPHHTQIGGRGLWLAGQLCDNLDINSSTGGTTVRMAMRL
jgi:serine/threonine-protein kinase RsbW